MTQDEIISPQHQRLRDTRHEGAFLERSAPGASRPFRKTLARRSPNPFLLLGCRNPPGFAFHFGLGQETKAGLAPREIDADIQQRIGTPAGTGKFHDGEHAVGLSGLERHRPARHMVRGGSDAKNKIAGSDCVAHGFHPLSWEEVRRRPPRTKDRFRRIAGFHIRTCRSIPQPISNEPSLRLCAARARAGRIIPATSIRDGMRIRHCDGWMTFR